MIIYILLQTLYKTFQDLNKKSNLVLNSKRRIVQAILEVNVSSSKLHQRLPIDFFFPSFIFSPLIFLSSI